MTTDSQAPAQAERAKAPTISPDATPTGWSGQQLEVLAPALGDAVTRFVRQMNGEGVRLRPAHAASKSPASVRVCILNEAGAAVTLDESHAALVAKLAEPFGLGVEQVGDTLILKVASSDATEGAAVEPPTGEARTPRTRGAR